MSKGLLMRWSWTLFPLVPLQLVSGPPSAFPVSAKMACSGFMIYWTVAASNRLRVSRRLPACVRTVHRT